MDNLLKCTPNTVHVLDMILLESSARTKQQLESNPNIAINGHVVTAMV